MFRDQISAFLESEGHAATTSINEHDGDYAYIGFRSRGLSLTVHTIEGDNGFLHIVAKVEMALHRLDELTVRRLLMKVQHQRKNVKCSVSMEREYVTFHAEQFVTQDPESPEFRRVFWRAVDVIEEAAHDVRRQLRALDTPKAAAERFINEMRATLGTSETPANVASASGAPANAAATNGTATNGTATNAAAASGVATNCAATNGAEMNDVAASGAATNGAAVSRGDVVSPVDAGSADAGSVDDGQGRGIADERSSG